MVRLFDDGIGGKKGVTKDKVRDVRKVQRHRPQKQRPPSARIRTDKRLND